MLRVTQIARKSHNEVIQNEDHMKNSLIPTTTSNELHSTPLADHRHAPSPAVPSPAASSPADTKLDGVNATMFDSTPSSNLSQSSSLDSTDLGLADWVSEEYLSPEKVMDIDPRVQQAGP
jgi:hypothetical protein